MGIIMRKGVAYGGSIGSNGSSGSSNGIDEINSKTKNRSIIFISDSYGNRVNSDNKTFFTLIAEYLGLDSSSYFHNNVAGAAFAHGTESCKFLTLLQSLENTISADKKNSCTDIIVIGGANDARYEYSATLEAIRAFSEYARNAYPNAKITLAHVGLTFTQEGMNAIREKGMKAWKDSVIYGVNYMTNSEYVLCNTKLLESDSCHPNIAGVDFIAKQVTRGILCGSCDVHHAINYTDLTATVTIANGNTTNGNVRNVHCNMTHRNGVVTLHGAEGIFSLKFSTSSHTINAGQEIDFDFSDTLFCGFPDANKTHYGFVCKEEEPSVSVPCAFFFTKSGVNRLRVFMLGSLGNTYGLQLYLNATETL